MNTESLTICRVSPSLNPANRHPSNGAGVIPHQARPARPTGIKLAMKPITIDRFSQAEKIYFGNTVQSVQCGVGGHPATFVRAIQPYQSVQNQTTAVFEKQNGPEPQPIFLKWLYTNGVAGSDQRIHAGAADGEVHAIALLQKSDYGMNCAVVTGVCKGSCKTPRRLTTGSPSIWEFAVIPASGGRGCAEPLCEEAFYKRLCMFRFRHIGGIS